MKNSKELCLPMCMPFTCFEVDSRTVMLPKEEQSHYYAELFLIREGRLKVFMGEKEYSVGPEDALVCCPGVVHRVAPDGEEPVRFDLLRMDPERMPGMPDYAPSLRLIFAAARRENAPMLIQAEDARSMALPYMSARCLQEMEERPYGCDLSVKARLGLICLALIRHWKKKGLTLKPRESQEDPVYALSGYIEEHLKDGLRVEELAARCHLSYPWFAKKFREIYGVSCKDFIEQIRVGQVEQYLLYTDLDLTEISEVTGYADCSHMIKNFKRIRNVTPGQYRLRQR